MKKSTHYFRKSQSCKMLLATPASIIDCTPATLMAASGGAYASTDPRALPLGQFASHDSELPPTDAIALPAYVSRHVAMVRGIVQAKASEQTQPKIETTQSVDSKAPISE